MLKIRVNMGPPRNHEWTCCFGLHVRTATIMIGLWHLVLNVLALGILVAVLRNPYYLKKLQQPYEYEDISLENSDAPALPTPLSKIESPYPYRDPTFSNHNIDMGGLVCIGMIGISLMLIYGAAKFKPAHLLPFFCLQLFDFALTTLTAAGYLCYLRSIHHIIGEAHRLPWRDELLKLSPQRLGTVVLLIFVSVVMIKAYALGIVWRCYKYLTIQQNNMRSMLPYIIPDMTNIQERDYNTLLPDYEEAIAQSLKQQPPPSYQVAMAHALGNSVTDVVVNRPISPVIAPINAGTAAVETNATSPTSSPTLSETATTSTTTNPDTNDGQEANVNNNDSAQPKGSLINTYYNYN